MLQSFCTQAQSSTDEDVLYKRGGAAEKQLTKYDYTFLKEWQSIYLLSLWNVLRFQHNYIDAQWNVSGLNTSESASTHKNVLTEVGIRDEIN